MKKFIWNTLIIIYAIIAILVTISLLSYNDYKNSEVGDYTLIPINTRELEPEYKRGDLIITDRSYKPEVGQKVFFYNKNGRDVQINIGEITEKQEYTVGDISYTIEGKKVVGKEDVLGTVETTKQISTLGTILGILQSKWGFLVLIVLPSLIAFLFEIAELFSELRNGSKEKE